MPSDRNSTESTRIELTLAEFSKQWPHALRLLNRARSAAAGALPDERLFKKPFEVRADKEAAPILKRLLNDEAYARSTFRLRELDLLPAESIYWKHAVTLSRKGLRDRIQKQYRAKAKKLLSFFHKQLLGAVRSRGAIVSARNEEGGAVETLRLADLQNANPDFNSNTLTNRYHSWHSAMVTLTSPWREEDPPSTSSSFSAAELRSEFKAWIKDQQPPVHLGTAWTAMKDWNSAVTRDSVEGLIKELPSEWRAVRGRPTSKIPTK